MMKVRMSRIIDEYNRLGGGYWFDDSTMKFFRTRLPDYGYMVGNLFYFVSSENDGSRGRKWTIRQLDFEGQINTIGEFYVHTKMKPIENWLIRF